MRNRRGFAFATEERGRRSKFALEGAIEGGFGTVTDGGSDFRDAIVGRLEKLGTELETPFGEIGHGRIVQEVGEAVGEASARRADMAREAGNGPLLRGIFVHKGERLSDDGIASAGKPTDLVCWKSPDVAAQRFDKEKFGEFCDNDAAACAGVFHFADGEFDGIGEPLAGRFLRDVDLHQFRQAGENDFAEAWVAGHVTANKFGDIAAPTVAGKFETIGDVLCEDLKGVDRFCGRAVAQEMRVAVRKNHDVAGGEFVPGAIGEVGEGVAFGQEMINDNVAAGGGEHLLGFGSGGRAEAPGRGELTVKEKGALEFDGAQNI